MASPLADVSGLAEAGSREVSLSGVFDDPDGDALTFTARSSNDDVVRALVSPIEDAMLLVGGIAGTATVTVTAEDVYGNQVSDAFEVTVGGSGDNPQTLEPVSPYADLIAKVTEWRNDQRYKHLKPHTDRWDRVLKALGETVADTTLTAMPADEAQGYADRGSGWERWVEVATALKEIERRRAGHDQPGAHGVRGPGRPRLRQRERDQSGLPGRRLRRRRQPTA